MGKLPLALVRVPTLMDAVKAVESDQPPGQWSEKDVRDINCTKAGLALTVTAIILNILIGFVQLVTRGETSIGYLGYYSIILYASGALLVVLGRNVFGPKHSYYATVAISLYAAIWALSSLGAFDFKSLYVFIIQNAIGIDSVLLTYGLQNVKGRILLWVSYLGGIAWAATLVSELYWEPPAFLTGPLSILFTLAPVGIYAVATSLPLARIFKSEIPAPLESVTLR